MNNAYKLVYSAALNAWVVVGEHVRGRGKQGTVRLICAATLFAVAALQGSQALAAPPATPPSVNQLPTGAQVASGAVSISQTQTAAAASMAISQTSNNAIVNWQSFNVGANAQVNITQPGSSSVLLNRVQSSDPSQIFGQIKANGQVFLTNPNGVYFAPGSSVDVGSFTATTHGISDSDFLSGHYQFKRNGATGSILNQGSITAGLGGYIALLAPEVRNQGVVVAQVGGAVAIAAGESMQLQFNANKQLTNVLVTPATIQALVDNGQAVQARGGLIILSAQAANGLLGGVVKNSGAISATGLVSDGGSIRLSASHKIELARSSTISADAAPSSAGNGGRIEIIAELSNTTSRTLVDGTLSAKGGQQGGDGGFVETSAVNLNIAETTRVSTLAPKGNAGTWLLDPEDFKVAVTGGNITPSNLVAALNSSGVTISTTATTASCVQLPNVACGSGGAGNGDISIDSPISGWTANPLTLAAYRNVNVNAAITGSGNSTLIVHGGAGGVINLNADIATGGAQTYTGLVTNGSISTGAVVLGANAALSNTHSNVIFYSSIDSASGNNFGLSVTNGTGETKLLGGVGRNDALGFLNLGGTGPITFAGDIYTTGAQSYSGPVSLFAITSRDFLLKTTNSKVEFLSKLDAADQNFSGETLTITNGSGHVLFGGLVGSVLPLGYLTVTGGSTATAQTTTFSADVKTNGAQTYGGNVKLDTNLSLSTWQNGNVSIAGNVDTTFQSSLLFQFLGGGNYSYSSNSGASFVNYVAAGNSSYAANVIAGFGSVSYDSTGSGTYTWTPSSTLQASYLAIGGGGSGGDRTGGGGGAGGVLSGNANFGNAASYSIVVGAGGVITSDIGYSSGVAGYASSLSGTGVSIVAYGGGGGGVNINAGGLTRNRSGTVGGSGGGGSDAFSGSGTGIPIPGSAVNPTLPTPPTLNQGNSGGASDYWGGQYSTGGGGGAGGAGQNGNSAIGGGAGGLGIANPIAGSNVGQNSAGTYYIAGGGGGGSFGANATGGLGGGGSSTGNSATARALANSGGGGGGSKSNGSSSGAGGSGSVVINGSVSNQFSLSISAGSGKTSIVGSVANVTALSIASTHVNSQVTGAIAGSTEVTKSGGGGVLSLSGNNTYTGGTTITGGTIQAGSSSNLGFTSGPLGTGAVALSGGRLDLNGQSIANDLVSTYSTANLGAIYNSNSTSPAVASGNMALASNSTIGGSNDFTLSGMVSGAFSLNKVGTSTATLSGNNTYSGGTTISAGTLKAGSTSALGSGFVTVAGGAALDLNGQTMTSTGAISLNGNGVSNGGAITNSSATGGVYAGSIMLATDAFIGSVTGGITLTNVLSGSASLTKTGAGTLTLSGSNTYSGITWINEGILKLGSSNALGNSTSVRLSDTLDLNGQTLTNTAVTIVILSNSNKILNSSGTKAVFPGKLNPYSTQPTFMLTGGDIEMSGALGGAASGGYAAGAYQGAYLQGTNSLILSGTTPALWGDAPNAYTPSDYWLHANSGSPTLKITGTFGTGFSRVETAMTLDYQSSSDMGITSDIAGAPNAINIIKGGLGTLTISGRNFSSGVFNVNAGTLALSNSTQSNLTSITVNTGGTLDFQNANFDRPITLNGGVLSTSTGASTLSGVVSGSGLTKTGIGTLLLSNANTYSGGTTVSAGTLRAGGNTTGSVTNGPFGTNTVTVNGGTVDLYGFSVANAFSLGAGGATGALINNSGNAATASGAVSLTADSSLGGTGVLTVSGAISSGSYGLALLGAGAKTLSSNNNALTTLASGAGLGALTVVNNAALTIGQVATGGSTYNGIDSTGTVSIITRTGDLSVSQNIATTSTSSSTSSPALKLSAADGTAAGTLAGGNVVLAGAPSLSVGTGGIAVIYSGDPGASAGVGTALGAHVANFSLYNKSTANANLLTAAGYYALYRASGVPIYLLAATGQSSVYGSAPELSYWYSSSASSVVPVVYAGIPTTAQTYSLVSGAVSNAINVTSGVTGTLALTGSPSIAAGGLVSTTHAGTYVLTLTPSLSLAGYIFSAGNAVNYTISPKPITVTSASRTTTYDGVSTYANLTSTTPFSASAMVGTDALASVTQTSTPSGVAQAGSFVVTPSAAVMGSGNANNYTFGYAPGTHTVSPVALMVTAGNASKTYDGTSYAGGNGVNYSGFVNSETAAALSGTLSYSGTSQGARNAGSYVITPAGLSGSNYALNFADGTLQIDPAPLTLTAVSNTKSFDGNTTALSVPLVSGLKGLDAIANLTEVYVDANPGNNKTLVVSSAYVIQDGNGGRNYVVTTLPDATGVIRALPVAVLPPSNTLPVSNGTPVPEPLKPIEVTPVLLTPITQSNAASGPSSPVVDQGVRSSTGVVVSTISQSTQQVPGLVTVLVPSGTSTSGTGLSIALPESVFAWAQPTESSERVTLPDQRPLPAWIRYDASNKSLVTGAVPEGAFPITVWVILGGQVTVVQISETQAKL